MNLPKKISHRVVAKSIIIVVEKKTYTLIVDAEKKKSIVAMLDKFNKKPSETGLAKIIKTFTPKETKTKELAVANKKKAKRTLADAERELKEANKKIAELEGGLVGKVKVIEETSKSPEEAITKTKEAVKEEVKQEAPVLGHRRGGEH